MGRTRKGAVLESAEELQALLDRLGSSPYEPRVRFLMAIKEDPRIKSEVLMGVLGLSDRTIRRWWSDYLKRGLLGFLDSPTVGMSGPIVAESSPKYDDSDGQALMALLNSLPIGCDMTSWKHAVETALARYLTGIDRVEVIISAIEDSTSLSEPDRLEVRTSSSCTLDLGVMDDVELGRLRLYARPGTAIDSALELLEELRPFLTFLYTDAVARANAARPQQSNDASGLLSEHLAKSLTPRERDVLLHRLYGYSYSEASERLGVSEETIRKCVKNIYRKTDTSSMGELFVRYFSAIGGEPLSSANDTFTARPSS
jgi:DNA-binding CsgD family transcriptional regulator